MSDVKNVTPELIKRILGDYDKLQSAFIRFAEQSGCLGYKTFFKSGDLSDDGNEIVISTEFCSCGSCEDDSSAFPIGDVADWISKNQGSFSEVIDRG